MLVTERLSSNNSSFVNIFHIDECLHFLTSAFKMPSKRSFLKSHRVDQVIRAWHLGVRIFVVMVDVLLSGLGSGVVDVTDAVFVIVPVPAD